MAKDDLRQQGGGGGQKLPILRRHSLWTAPNGSMCNFDDAFMLTPFPNGKKTAVYTAERLV